MPNVPYFRCTKPFNTLKRWMNSQHLANHCIPSVFDFCTYITILYMFYVVFSCFTHLHKIELKSSIAKFRHIKLNLAQIEVQGTLYPPWLDCTDIASMLSARDLGEKMALSHSYILAIIAATFDFTWWGGAFSDDFIPRSSTFKSPCNCVSSFAIDCVFHSIQFS